MILADSHIKCLPEYDELRRHIWSKATEVVEPNCDGWTWMIDEGVMDEKFLTQALQRHTEQGRIDLAVIVNTHFWEIRHELTHILKWQTTIIDQERELTHDICRALRLRGVDGKRNK